MFTEFPLPYYDFVKLLYEWLWSRCGILVYTIFHYPTRATFNTCSIIACPLVFAIHAKWYTLQPRGCSQTILHLCVPLTWIGKWGPVLECYTELWYCVNIVHKKTSLLKCFTSGLVENGDILLVWKHNCSYSQGLFILFIVRKTLRALKTKIMTVLLFRLRHPWYQSTEKEHSKHWYLHCYFGLYDLMETVQK